MKKKGLLWTLLLALVMAYPEKTAGQNSLVQPDLLADVPYRTDATPAQRMDLFIPANARYPVVLFVHEGSLLQGSKNDEPLGKIAAKFQAAGIGFAVMNYRLGPVNKWPAQPDDVAAAFDWLKNKVAGFNGDSSRIFIAGHSSGAMLASLIATDKKYLKSYNHSIQEIAGIVLLGTQLKPVLPAVSAEKLAQFFEQNDYLKIFGDTATFNDASAIKHVNCDMPPALILIAEAEQFNPPILRQTEEFVAKLKECKPDINYRVIPGRTHMSNLTGITDANDEVYSLIKNFIDTH